MAGGDWRLPIRKSAWSLYTNTEYAGLATHAGQSMAPYLLTKQIRSIWLKVFAKLDCRNQLMYSWLHRYISTSSPASSRNQLVSKYSWRGLIMKSPFERKTDDGSPEFVELASYCFFWSDLVMNLSQWEYYCMSHRYFTADIHKIRFCKDRC